MELRRVGESYLFFLGLSTKNFTIFICISTNSLVSDANVSCSVHMFALMKIHNSKCIFVKFLEIFWSKWGMEEFMIADAEAVGGRKNYIIIILTDKLDEKELTTELKTYLRTYTYIDATKNTEEISDRLRFSVEILNI